MATLLSAADCQVNTATVTSHTMRYPLHHLSPEGLGVMHAGVVEHHGGKDFGGFLGQWQALLGVLACAASMLVQQVNWRANWVT